MVKDNQYTTTSTMQDMIDDVLDRNQDYDQDHEAWIDAVSADLVRGEHDTCGPDDIYCGRTIGDILQDEDRHLSWSVDVRGHARAIRHLLDQGVAPPLESIALMVDCVLRRRP